eukprot:1378814-Rhodomonas_salina.4
MSTAQQPYLACVRSTLTAALCLQNFGCQEVERHNKPEVETGKASEVILNPVNCCAPTRAVRCRD